MKRIAFIAAACLFACCLAGIASAHGIDIAAPFAALADPGTFLALATAPAAVAGAADPHAALATDAAATDAAAAAAPAAASSKKVKARVLFAGAFGKVNQVVLVDPDSAKAGVAAGELDTSKSAIAYAESLAG